MALTLIPPSGIDPSGNYTVNGITVSANASIANLTVTTTSNLGAVGNIYIYPAVRQIMCYKLMGQVH